MDLTDRHVAALQSKTRQHGMYVFTEPVPQAQDGHNCDASLWINEQGHISAEPLEMFLWEIRVQVMQNQVAIAMGNRVGTEGDVAFAGQSVVVDPYVNAASEADDQEQLIIADIDLTQTAAARKQRPFLGLRRPEWYV